MSKKYSLELTSSSGDAKDLLDNFNFVVLEMPFVSKGELKELAKAEYPDEDGEDVYVPAQRRFKSRTISVKIGYEGGAGTAFNAFSSLEGWLAGAGMMSVYSEWIGAGYNECTYEGVSDDLKYTTMVNSDILEVTIKFAVHNPTNIVTK